MPTKKQDKRSDAKVFKALANDDRRVILDCLKKGGRTTKELCTVLGHLDRCTVMLHLNVLTESELVISKKRGRCRWNYLNVAPIQGIYNRWIKSYEADAAGLMLDLKTALEAG